MGWLARRYGLACDNVARFQVVTADGEVLHASRSENPDLDWALRGGGGNFDGVTEFEFDLHQVGTAALVADLWYPRQDAAAAMQNWRDLIPQAPAQATFTAWVGTTGRTPSLPPEVRNRPMAAVGYVWVGDPGQGRRLLPALRADRGGRWVRVRVRLLLRRRLASLPGRPMTSTRKSPRPSWRSSSPASSAPHLTTWQRKPLAMRVGRRGGCGARTP